MSEKYFVGIDLGGTNLKVGLLDERYRIVDKLVLSTRDLGCRDELIKAICSAVKDVVSDNKLKNHSIFGVGIGLPGPVDAESGLVHFFPNIPGWKNVPLKKILEKNLKLPVFIDNDAKAMSLAEYEIGSARGSKSAVCITLGTGVGGGIIIDGDIYRGKNNAAGEIGHLPINLEGPKCNCGGKACLEAYIGNKRISQRVKKIFKRDIALDELSRMAVKGSKPALKIWREVGEYLGVALTAVVNLLNPDCIVIGGGVSGAGNILFKRVKEVVLERAMPVQARQVKILKARLGNDAGMIGAGIIVARGLSL